MGNFVSYVMRWAVWIAPIPVTLCVLKGKPLWFALPVIGLAMFAATISWLATLICCRHGGDLGRKLARPL